MNEKLNIQDLMDLLTARTGINKKNSEAFVREFFALIEESLEKDKYVKIKGLGTFKLINVESRESVNVNTGERIEIHGHSKVSFTPDSSLKEIINKPFSHFETVVLNEGVVFEDMPVEGDADDSLDGSSEFTADPVMSDPVMSDPVMSEPAIEKPVIEETVIEETEAAEMEESPADPIQKVAAKETADCEQEVVADAPADKPKTDITEEKSVEVEKQTFEREIVKEAVAENRCMKYVVYGMVLTALVCLAVVAFMYLPFGEDSSGAQVSDAPKQSTAVSPKPAMETVLPDSTVAQQMADTLNKDTVQVVPKEQPAPKVQVQVPSTPEKKQVTVTATAKPKTAPKQPFVSDSVGYTIIGTETNYTLKEGETLTKVALRFYGTKALWPYIVKHNSDVIKNPNHVPYGTMLKIPKLKKKQ